MLRLRACNRGWTAIGLVVVRMIVVEPLELGAGKGGGATGGNEQASMAPTDGSHARSYGPGS